MSRFRESEFAALEPTVKMAVEQLRISGHRVTGTRIAILSELAKRPVPAAIEDLFRAVDQGPCHIVTVYRSMQAFEAVGLVRRSFAANGTVLWTLVRAGVQPYYIQCRDSNRQARIDADIEADVSRILEAAKSALGARGYTELTYSLEFFAARSKSLESP